MARVPPSVVGVGGVLGLFGAIYLVGLTVLASIVEVGAEPGTDPADPRLGVFFVVALLVVSAGMLLAFRWGLDRVIRGFVLVVSVVLAMLVFDVLLPATIVVAGIDLLATGLAILLGIAVAVRPRWYVIDLVGVILGAGVVALFGLSLGTSAALVLLILLAIYDAISVYGTKHMLSLAEGAMRSGLPVMLIVPVSRAGIAHPPDEDVEEADAVVIGLGDAIVPGMLVGSAVVHGPGDPLGVLGLSLTIPALGTLVGIAIGVVALFVVLSREGPHPGLPLLNAGAIAGYLVGAGIEGIGLRTAIGLAAIVV